MQQAKKKNGQKYIFLMYDIVSLQVTRTTEGSHDMQVYLYG